MAFAATTIPENPVIARWKPQSSLEPSSVLYKGMTDLCLLGFRIQLSRMWRAASNSCTPSRVVADATSDECFDPRKKKKKNGDDFTANGAKEKKNSRSCQLVVSTRDPFTEQVCLRYRYFSKWLRFERSASQNSKASGPVNDTRHKKRLKAYEPRAITAS